MVYCENIVDVPFLFQKIIFYLHGSKKKNFENSWEDIFSIQKVFLMT